ncbi:biopolymer transporter ExbD [Pelobium manganitolerans]|uniref:Biopolymer transporter ExbD n=1 Tax=Pelobium manganitolerans TaxID=1842495 RepID=A0A419SBR5_9SPHI|nr:biopolymer transporter ExbD [Pelobium manganitolerans]RKD20261.1 biopolymer transporter ExbD [Pelobium manganitolerans]
MAELDTSGGGNKKGGKVRSKKQSTRVDLTAMVDLAFLLITFFMLTTTLAKPQAMDMFMPDKDKQNPEETLDVKASRTMTVLLGDDNKIVWYMGVIGDNAPTVDNFGKKGIRQSLIDNNKKVVATTGNPEKGLMVIIKPSDQSNYKNFVDILDEIKIAGVPSYGINNKIEPAELTLMKEQGVFK